MRWIPVLFLALLLTACIPGVDLGLGDNNDNGDAEPTVATLTATFGPDATEGEVSDTFGKVTWAPGESAYTFGQSVNVKAEASEGWTFSHWTKGSTSSNSLSALDDTLTQEEFDAVVDNLLFGVATGTDGVPRVVFAESRLRIPADASQELIAELHDIAHSVLDGYFYPSALGQIDLANDILANYGHTSEWEEITVHPEVLAVAENIGVSTKTEAEKIMKERFGKQEATATFVQD